MPPGFASGRMSGPAKDMACTPMPPKADMRPELVSRLEGDVPRCSALPRVELPIWLAVSTPAYSVSVKFAPSSAPEVEVEL